MSHPLGNPEQRKALEHISEFMPPGTVLEVLSADGCLLVYGDGQRFTIDLYGQWRREPLKVPA